jgi:TRAP-type C4-dicarboxylate transport system permease small subunit
MTMLSTLDRVLERLETVLIALLCSGALILGVMQVVLRYVFNTGFHWNEVVFVTLTLWAMFLGGSRAVATNLHARVELLTEVAPPAVLRVLNLLALLAALALSGIYLVGGYQYVAFVNMMDVRDLDTGIPDAVTYGIVPFAMTLFVIRYVLKLIVWSTDPGDYSRSPVTGPSTGGM